MVRASQSADTLAGNSGRETIPRVFKPPSDDFANSLRGKTIDGKYELDAVLGSGGMGTVYRSTRLHIGDTVAVKVLRRELRTEPKSAERFTREARAAARLKHPNAVSIYDFGISGSGLMYLVMELVEGDSLRRIIKQGPLTIPDVAEITTQVCAALDEAHRHNVVHRDIKSDNIIVQTRANELHVKVLDFGLAKLRDMKTSNLTQTGAVMGTPHYMSPEQCMGEELDSRSDIYSFGVVLYEMLCGVLPFNSSVSSALVVQHVTQLPPSPRSLNPSIPVEVEKVVLHALQKQREARPPTAGALAQEMRSAVYDSPAVSQELVPVTVNTPYATAATREIAPLVVAPTLATPISGSALATLRSGQQSQYEQPAPAKSRKRWPLILGIGMLLVLVAGAVGTLGWMLLMRKDESQEKSNRDQAKQAQRETSANTEQTGSAEPSPSADRPTSTTDSADQEFKTLSDRRAQATPDQRSELEAALKTAEMKYPADYRFTFERAKLVSAGQKHHEAFSVLFQAGQKAIDSGKADEMLNSLMADKDGDFSKLSKGHDEWKHLEEALRNKDKSKLSAK